MTNKWARFLASVYVGTVGMFCISSCSDEKASSGDGEMNEAEQTTSGLQMKAIDPIVERCEAIACEKPASTDNFIIINILPPKDELASRSEMEDCRDEFQARGITPDSRFSVWSDTAQKDVTSQQFKTFETAERMTDLLKERKKALEEAGTQAGKIRICICADMRATWEDVRAAMQSAAAAGFQDVYFVVHDQNAEVLRDFNGKILNPAACSGLVYGGSLQTDPTISEQNKEVAIGIESYGTIFWATENPDHKVECGDVSSRRDLLDALRTVQEYAKAEGKVCAVRVAMDTISGRGPASQQIVYVLSALHETGIRQIYLTDIPPAEDAPPSPDPPPPEFSDSPSPSSMSVAPQVIVVRGDTSAVTAPITINAADGLDLSSSIDISIGDGMGCLGDGLGDGGSAMDFSGGGSALEGTFYDLKQTRSGSATPIADTPKDGTQKLIKNFIEGNWNRAMLNGYYQSPAKLYASTFYMPQISAGYAPYAFQCSDRVREGAWVSIYRGKVRAPKTGKFRFVGGGDDVIAVRFNNKTVLEWGSEVPTTGFSSSQDDGEAPLKEDLRQMQAKGYGNIVRYKKGDAPNNPAAAGFERFCNEVGLIEGIPFEVKEGKVYPIEILISEFNGGAFSFFLFIEDMGDSSGRAKSGAKIYQIFRTNFSNPDHDTIKNMVEKDNKKAQKEFNTGLDNDNLEGPPFDEDSLIWTVVP